MRTTLRSSLVGLAAFAATALPAAAHTELDFPDGGETFQVGEPITIEWRVTIAHALTGWDVLYSTNGAGGPFVPIALGLPPGDESTGAVHRLDWVVPDMPTTDGRVLIRMNGSGGGLWESMSESDFTIASPLGVRSCANQNANSSGSPASLYLTGSASASANALTLRVVDLPTNTVGYPINSMALGFAANPGGSQGNLCLGGTIGRHAMQIAGSGSTGSVAIPIDLTQLPRVGALVSASAGETWSFQFWFRDANPQATSNFSDVVSVTLL